MRIVHLFVSYAQVNLCHCFSSYWYQGLAATSACGSPWTFSVYLFVIIFETFYDFPEFIRIIFFDI